MTDTTNAAPTLRERLAKASGVLSGSTLKSIALAATVHSSIGDTDIDFVMPVDALAAIEAAMIDAATAPLRAKIESSRQMNQALRNTTAIEIARLRTQNAALRQELDDERKDHGKMVEKYALLRARADALKAAASEFHDLATRGGYVSTSWIKSQQFVASRKTYDAATASAGEDVTTPTDADTVRHELIHRMRNQVNVPEFDHFPMSEGAMNRWLDQWDRDIAECGYIEDPSFAFQTPEPAPTPTDAQRRDAAPRCPECKGKGCKRCDGYGNHPIAPTLTEADSIPIEFDGVGESDQDPALQARPDRERIDDLVTRADGASDRLDMHMQRMDSLQRQIGNLQRRIAALEAARTPDPVVTDAMVEEFWQAYVNETGDALSHAAVLVALAAALKAGGAR